MNDSAARGRAHPWFHAIETTRRIIRRTDAFRHATISAASESFRPNRFGSPESTRQMSYTPTSISAIIAMSKTTVAVPAPVAFSERGILPRLVGHFGLRQRIRPGLHGGTGCSDGLVKTIPPFVRMLFYVIEAVPRPHVPVCPEWFCTQVKCISRPNTLPRDAKNKRSRHFVPRDRHEKSAPNNRIGHFPMIPSFGLMARNGM